MFCRNTAIALTIVPAKPSAGALHRRVEAVVVADGWALVHADAAVLHAVLVGGQLVQARTSSPLAGRGEVLIIAA